MGRPARADLVQNLIFEYIENYKSGIKSQITKNVPFEETSLLIYSMNMYGLWFMFKVYKYI